MGEVAPLSLNAPETLTAARRIAERPGVGVALRVLQQRALHISGVFVERPGLSFVRRGEKQVRAGGFDALMREGEAVALPAGITLEVTNIADPSGLYEALSLVPDPALVAAARAEAEGRRPLAAPMHLAAIAPAFAGAMVRAIEAITDPVAVPEAVAVLRMREVLAWLGTRGVWFDIPRPTSAAARVRQLLAGAPGQRWPGPEVARALAMSEATLRRRLAAEGTTLSDILADVRMSTALTLLQATDRSIAEVALEVGYESPSRFAARFRRRFGHPPAAVRQGDPDFDRPGIGNDRRGSAAASLR
jgi:AraC-like DNA-binding protein